MLYVTYRIKSSIDVSFSLIDFIKKSRDEQAGEYLCVIMHFLPKMHDNTNKKWRLSGQTNGSGEDLSLWLYEKKKSDSI